MNGNLTQAYKASIARIFHSSGLVVGEGFVVGDDRREAIEQWVTMLKTWEAGEC